MASRRIALPEPASSTVTEVIHWPIHCAAAWSSAVGVSRRTFVGGLTGAALFSEAKPKITIVWGSQPAPAGPALRFTRAYAACPEPELAQACLMTGRFPHAVTADSPRIETGPLTGDSLAVFTSAPDKTLKVPLAIHCPRLFPQDRTEDFLISQVDIMPTMIGLCGLEGPAGVQGRDLSGLLTSGTGERPESIYAEGDLGKPGEWRMIVRGLDKIVFNRGLRVTRLYNLGADPDETENLASQTALELRRNELRALLQVWIRRTEDNMDASGLKRRR